MYKIEVMSAGKYGNVMLGSRYCFSARNTKRIIRQFRELECIIFVTKFIKCGDCWCWSEDHKLREE